MVRRSTTIGRGMAGTTRSKRTGGTVKALADHQGLRLLRFPIDFYRLSESILSWIARRFISALFRQGSSYRHLGNGHSVHLGETSHSPDLARPEVCPG